MAKLSSTYENIQEHWHALTDKKYFWPLFMIAGIAFCMAASTFEFLEASTSSSPSA